ncbi:hypothetical protein T492DRAFT_1035028 [Pavlovales sp. CCMP2436]|nr:hypothetical protein T492DRAFT_1035028 [Pavlovales sp. CCMP2436]
MAGDALERAREALETKLLGIDPRTAPGALAARQIFGELGILKRSSVLAAARTSKVSLLERQQFQRTIADFQPGERKTTLGLAAGHLVLSLLRVKLVLSIASVLVEQLAASLPAAEGSSGDRLVRRGGRAQVQRVAYYGASLLLSTLIPQMGWLLMGSALLMEPDSALGDVLPALPLPPLGARRRWAHSAVGSLRELLRVLRPLAQSAEVALLLLGWYTAFAG